MGEINFSMTYFSEQDGNTTSLEERIESVIGMIENENDYILIDKTHSCKNEGELRDLLSEKNIL